MCVSAVMAVMCETLRQIQLTLKSVEKSWESLLP